MKTSTTIIFVLLFAFAAIVNAQTNSTSGADDNPVAKCIQQKNCGSDMSCIAKCAGVPDPSPKDANDTNTCVSKCNQSDPTPTYEACVKNCINTVYMPTGDSSSSTPSGSAAPSGSSGSPDATKSASGSTSSSTGGSSGNGTKSAAQSLDAKIAFSNSLSMMATLLLVCVVARMTNVGF